MSTSPPPIRNLRSPPVAALLTLLIPGLGHLYQGRFFKGALFSICILGTFFFGYRLGDGKVCYWDWPNPERRTWAYVCQVWTGAVAWPAVMQSRRDPDSYKPELLTSLSAPFEGKLLHIGKVKGTLKLTLDKSAGYDSIQGELSNATVTTAEGEQPLDGTLSRVVIDPQVFPDPRRRFAGDLSGKSSGRLEGSIPRSIFDYYEAPLLDQEQPSGIVTPTDRRKDLSKAHSELGPRFELGVVYTMVAGLLNILAIFDTLEGPAYEVEEDEPEPAEKEKPKLV